MNGRAGERRILNHRWDDPADVHDPRHDPGARDRGAEPGAAAPGRAGDAQPAAARLRPHAHLRPGLPARGGGLLGRHEVPLPGHRRARDHPLHALAGRADHQLRRDRHARHAGAGRDRPRGAPARPAAVAARAGRARHEGVAGVFCGESSAGLGRRPPRSRRAATSVWSTSRSKRVLSIMPAMYDDLWTAAKGMYKMEPVVADGGEVVIYAPHIREVSHVHGALIDEIGYHCRDYFLKQWERFEKRARRHPGALDARARASGPTTRRPASRRRAIRVTLATASPASAARRSTSATSIRPAIEVEAWQSARRHAGRAARRRDAVPRWGRPDVPERGDGSRDRRRRAGGDGEEPRAQHREPRLLRGGLRPRPGEGAGAGGRSRRRAGAIAAVRLAPNG